MSNAFYNTMPSFFLHPRLVVGLITLFAALIRLVTLGYKSLWLDEAVVWQIANNPLAEAIAQNTVRNSAPPLFITLLKGVLLFGDSEFVMRLLPALAGIAAVPAMYGLARQFLERVPAYFTTALVAVTITMVNFSQQLREYSLTVLWTILLLWAFTQFLRFPTWRNWAYVTVMIVISLFTQYGMALLIVALNLVWAIEWVLSPQRQWRDALKWGLAQGVGLLAAGAVYGLGLQGQVSNVLASGYLQAGYWDGTSGGLFNLTVWGTWKLLTLTYAMPGRSMVLFLGLLTIGLWGVWQSNHRRHLLLLIITPIMVVFILALVGLYPYDGNRQIIFLTPMLYILAGYGFAWLTTRFPQWWIAGSLATGFIALGFVLTWGLVRSEGTEHLRPLVDTLKREVQPSDRIYVYSGAVPAFTYYYREPQPAWIESTGNLATLSSYNSQLDMLTAQPGRLWLVFSHCVAEECTYIADYAGQKRRVELKGETTGATLYLAP
jgi:uncharacterized membrane protein